MENVSSPLIDKVDGLVPPASVSIAPNVHRILQSPAFAELRLRRRRLAIVLTVLMCGIYYGFILAIAFAPKMLAIKIDGVITLGIPMGLGVIVAAVVLTGVYVRRANREFDALTAKALGSVRS